MCQLDRVQYPKTDLADTQKKLKATQSDQSTLQDQLNKLKKANDIQTFDNQQLQTKEQGLQKEIANDTTKIQTEQQEVKNDNKQVSNLNNKINDLTNQLSQKDQENNQDSQDISQAVKQAQETRDHADTVVSNSK
ncbi:hypothetical protein [Limosilactobacillus fermentum]|uniref:hypothetical protein n=1 Tax=Limosilactobacillus fermentum TaxID=1613 RepID=UPI000C24B431|nr:hypothetical protein [Limosilactobacillus fermentum]